MNCKQCHKPFKANKNIRCSRCKRANKKRSITNSKPIGHTYIKRGYVMLKQPDHPRASNGYVFEHIVVMEQKLGRYLEAQENVHHINGVKGDNRPSNLELWTRSQPTGARVEDKVKWAREILRKYG